MTRISLAACLLGSSIALVSTAESQVLRREVTSNSTASWQLHTQHARPVPFRPFMVSGQVNFTCTINYSVMAVNGGGSDVTFRPQMDRSETFVGNTTCWGGDISPSSWRPVSDSFTVAAGATQTLTGTEVLTGGSGIPTDMTTSGCTGQDDGIHTVSGLSNIYAGPTTFFGWWTPEPNIALSGDSWSLANDMVVTTIYEFPLVSVPSGCDPLQLNSTGLAGSLEAFGEADANDGFLLFQGSRLPANMFGFIVLSATTQPATPAGFGQATLCLGSPQYRWLDSLALTSATGEFTADAMLDDLPLPAGALAAGTSWAFQLFHRDLVGGVPSANSTNAVIVSF